MSAITTETSDNTNSSKSVGPISKGNWLTKQWKRLPFQIRTLLLPFLLFLFILIITTGVSYKAKLDIPASLGVIGSVVSIYTAVVALLTWINLQKLQYTVPEAPTTTGDMSAILVVDVGNHGAIGNIIKYCQEEKSFAGIIYGTEFDNAKLFTDINEEIQNTKYRVSIPNVKVKGSSRELRIVNVTCPVIEFPENSSEWEKKENDPARAFYGVFRLVDRALHENGISELHIFYAGPVFIPFFLAELLSNQFKVYVYHRYSPGSADKKMPTTYKYVGVMDHMQYR